MSRFAEIAQFLDDRMNPIVVKECRQAVQNRLVMTAIILSLSVNTLITCIYLIDQYGRGPDQSTAGAQLFSVLFGILAVGSFIFVPLFIAWRIMVERNPANIDMLYASTISASQIIRGKFLAGMALLGLIYCASLPFLTFTYLLRGIDLPTIFIVMVNSFLATSLGIMFAILAATSATTILMRIFLGIGLFYAGMMLIGAVMATSFAMSSGMSAIWGGSGWAEVLLWYFGIGFFSLIFSYLLSVAAISPKTSNRMLSMRIFLTASWILIGIALWLNDYLAGSTPGFGGSTFEIVWGPLSVFWFSVFMGLALTEREEWTPRVRRTIPKSLPMRFLAWLFYTGSAGGVVWCCLMIGISLLVHWQLMPYGVDDEDERMLGFTFAAITALYVFCYGMSGVFLRRLILPRSTPLVSLVLAAIFFGLACSIPSLVFIYLNRGARIEALPLPFRVFNPFMIQEDNSNLPRVEVIWFLFAWTGVMFLLSIKWFWGQWSRFTRFEPEASLEADALSPGVESASPVMVSQET